MIITQYSPAPRNKNDQKILNNIQIPNLPNNPTDKDIYKYYGITKEEQKIIEEVVNYTKPSKRVPKLEGQDDPALGVEPEPDPDAPHATDVSKKSKSKTLKKKKNKKKKKKNRRTIRKKRKHKSRRK